MWTAALMLLAAIGCGPSNTVETPKEPITKLTEKSFSGPPPGSVQQK
jgi:hypothetical protein